MTEYDEQAVRHAIQVQESATQRLLALPGVNLVSVGPKETGGENTGTLAVQVWVDVKLPLEEIPPELRIPEEIDGIPTDVYIGGRTRLVVDPGSRITKDTDGGRYRPAIRGGTRIGSKIHGGFGTMGCIVHDPADVEVAYGLTNHHVVSPPGFPAPTVNDTRVGQPTNESSSTACCDDIVGTYVGGAFSGVDRDEALFRLSPGVKFTFEIEGVGFVRDTYDITAADALANFPVRKRGARSRLTGGVIVGLNATGAEVANQLIIRPNPIPGEVAGDVIFFDIEGDSGSALLDTVPDPDPNKKSCRVAGLINRRDWTRAELQAQGLPVPPLPADGIERVNGFAIPIGKILARFAAVENIQVVVGKASQAGQVHTVPGGSSVAVPAEVARTIMAEPVDRAAFMGDGNGDGLRAPVGRAWFAEGRPPEEALTALREGLDATATGRMLITFWLTHQQELNHLVRNDRRVTLAWHRGGGAALLQLLMHMVSRPDLALPETINGRTVLECADDLIAALSVRGSPDLRSDLVRVRAALPEVGGRTLAEIMTALAAADAYALAMEEVGRDG